MGLRRRMALVVVSVVATPLAVGGCTTERKAAVRSVEQEVPAPEPKVTVTPADRSRDVPVSAEVTALATGGEIVVVRIADDRGMLVRAERREDGATWVPTVPLRPASTYTVEATAVGDSGRTTTRTATFTTTAASTKPQVTSTLYVADGRTYGTAMPVTVGFDPPIAKRARAEVQHRLFVTTDPPQPGTWSWVDDGSQVYYRAPDFWRPGTTVSVRAALEGLPIGGNRVGDTDRTATFRIGRQVALEIDNAGKQMRVLRDGTVIRRIPVSLGKASTPTSSGRMVIMEKHQRTTFDTRGEPNGGYVVNVADAQRLTWGGEFIHGAPWSVSDQGHRNVSHGCTNVSPANADWLMKVTQVGDLVTVTGTEVRLEAGNGWTAWNTSWEQFVKGSALPVPDGLRPVPTATPRPGGSPTPGPTASTG
ncbi:Ig-like domain-containing protein [Micromonospora sp. WMMD1155]|uniref:L,D-transpeptidase n=1 Tax=Micromonospora sp. WMMD1155 TaxID=3016094 RepID=UPI00249B0DCD|nr:Ig-like domain-containing protein [Micromonospora sp. WMMD1155]WFE54607.1 Ig-like domain-containing protein [Micromonospora sp. WMMD1155]